MESIDDKFFLPEEVLLSEEYLENGYLIRPVEDRAALDRIRDEVSQITAEYLKIDPPADPEGFLNTIGGAVMVESLNDLRLHVIQEINGCSWLRGSYFSLLRSAIQIVVGNELAMQRRINLSIQLPDDDSSLLPVHADVWSGDAPFEAVLWLPLVDCFGTKTMFFAPPDVSQKAQDKMQKIEGGSSEKLFEEIKKDLIWLDVPYGHVVLFNQNLLHGNRINEESETRWTMNCRFKSLLSPYSDKKLGEFFEPITLRAATRIGMTYKLPGGFNE